MPIVNDKGFTGDDWHARGGRIFAGEEFEDAAEVPKSARGLVLKAGERAEALAPYLAQVSLIAVAFEGAVDGRFFSLARRLRALGFEGRLRARGPILPDQYAYARACGFDEVEISEEQAGRQPERQWLAAARSISLGYQKGYGTFGGEGSILEQRRHHRPNRLAG